MELKIIVQGRFLFGCGFGYIGYVGDRMRHLLNSQRTDLIDIGGVWNTAKYHPLEISCLIINSSLLDLMSGSLARRNF